MKQFILLTIILLPMTAAAESYLCVADQAAGFDGDDNWNAKAFSADEKYIVKPVTEPDSWTRGAEYMVTELGKTFPYFVCDKGFWEDGGLSCDGFMGIFRMNKNNLKFIWWRSGGYLEPEEDLNTDDAVMVRGKCSQL
jgi:hypothetical protein